MIREPLGTTYPPGGSRSHTPHRGGNGGTGNDRLDEEYEMGNINGTVGEDYEARLQAAQERVIASQQKLSEVNANTAAVAEHVIEMRRAFEAIPRAFEAVAETFIKAYEVELARIASEGNRLDEQDMG